MAFTNTKHQIQPDTPLQNIAAYVLIEKKVRKLRYGQSTVTLRIHDGKITDVLFQDFERIRLDIHAKKKGLDRPKDL